MNNSKARSCFFGSLIAVSMVMFTATSKVQAAACPGVTGATKFFKTVRSKVHKTVSQAQIESYNCIFQYWQNNKLSDKRWLSYAMATAWHESHMHPVREGFGGHRKAVNAAKFAWKKGWTKRRYDLPHPKTGKVYYGRGLVQITWAANYLKVGQQIGMGDRLYKNPDLALQPEIATKLMFHGMIKGLYRVEKRKSIMRKCGGPVKKYVRAKLGLYFNNRCNESYRARNMINGDLKKTAGKISKYARYYSGGLSPIPVSVTEDPIEVTEPEIKPQKPGDAGEPGGPVIDETPVKPVPDETSGDTTTPPVDKPDSEDRVVTPTLPGDTPVDDPDTGAGEGEGSDVVADGPTSPPTTPVDDKQSGGSQIDLAAFEALKTSNAAQAQKISSIETALGEQAKSLEENSAALTSANNKLASIEAKLEALGTSGAGAGTGGDSGTGSGSGAMADPKPPKETKTPVVTKPVKPKGWFGKTFDNVKGYVWKF